MSLSRDAQISVDASSSPPSQQSWKPVLTHPHLPELAGPQSLHQLQRLPGNLPLVLPPRLLGLLGLAGAAQPSAQPITIICKGKGEGEGCQYGRPWVLSPTPSSPSSLLEECTGAR